MPNRKVLMIIDVQSGFIKKGMDKTVANIEAKLKKNTYDLIIQTLWENYMGSQYEERLDYTDVGNSDQAHMMIQCNTDVIVSRCQYSAITEKMLKHIKKTDTIYVVGVDSDACVLATLFDLWDMGFEFYVYKDCINTSAKGLNDAVLKLIARNFGKKVLI